MAVDEWISDVGGHLIPSSQTESQGVGKRL